MNKTLKYTLIAILFVSLVILAYILIALPNNSDNTPMPDSQSADLPEGNVQEPVMIDTPVYMTVEEKNSFNIDPELKVQVLDRDVNGTVTAYKIINSDEDIQTFYYKPE